MREQRRMIADTRQTARQAAEDAAATRRLVEQLAADFGDLFGPLPAMAELPENTVPDAVPVAPCHLPDCGHGHCRICDTVPDPAAKERARQALGIGPEGGSFMVVFERIPGGRQ